MLVVIKNGQSMKLPELELFFLETPLYQRFQIGNDDGDALFNLIFFKSKLDCYCPFCDKDSTFIGTNKTPWVTAIQNYDSMVQQAKQNYKYFLNKIHHINMYCSRVENHKMQYTVYLTDKELLKIGQYPSFAEISQPELKKYKLVLSKEKYAELNRGVGLITHGVGIGAFVYLRRIFEDLIEDAHTKLSSDSAWDESIYQKSRMSEKIELLKKELPEFLVENKGLYGILSKGIHELTEEDCMNYFPTVKLGIELILDEKLEEKKRKDKIETAKKSLSKITSELKTNEE